VPEVSADEEDVVVPVEGVVDAQVAALRHAHA
jgi:hypothetical protein